MTGLAHDILLTAAALSAWAVSVLIWPFRACTLCRGTGRNRGSSSRRFGTCRRCNGRGRIQRIGSRTVHRIAWTIRGELLRQLERRRDHQAADRSEDPRRLADRK